MWDGRLRGDRLWRYGTNTALDGIPWLPLGDEGRVEVLTGALRAPGGHVMISTWRCMRGMVSRIIIITGASASPRNPISKRWGWFGKNASHLARIERLGGSTPLEI
jgi:hypothetical protein